MALHLIKLCVGADSLEELADWQKRRLKEQRAKGKKSELVHITRQTPRRADELLEGGSLYWVIKGQIAAHQRIIELRAVRRDSVPHCGIVYDKQIVTVLRRPRRAFGGLALSRSGRRAARHPGGQGRQEACRKSSNRTSRRWGFFKRLSKRGALAYRGHARIFRAHDSEVTRGCRMACVRPRVVAACGRLALDTDGAMRLAGALRDLLAGQSWFDAAQHRMDVPFGLAMHWSRLVDAPLAAIVLALRPFVGAHAAENAALWIGRWLIFFAVLWALARIADRAGSCAPIAHRPVSRRHGGRDPRLVRARRNRPSP